MNKKLGLYQPYPVVPQAGFQDVILVAMDWQRAMDDRSSLGTASIKAALEQHGARVTVITAPVNAPNFNLGNVINQVKRAVAACHGRPLIGIGCFVWNRKEVHALLRAILGLGTVVLGGAEITYSARGTLEERFPVADWFVRGAGEAAMVYLASGLQLCNTLGLQARGHDTGEQAQVPLEQLPSPYLSGALPPSSSVREPTAPPRAPRRHSTRPPRTPR